MQLDKIKARIQKLLAMAQDSSSPHEAAIAAERVQKLMTKFNLEMADVIAEELQDEDNLVKENRDFQYKRMPTYVQWIEVTIARAFDCETKRRRHIRGGIEYDVTEIYGYKTDVEVVKSLCHYICGQLDLMAKRVKVPEEYSRCGYSRRYMADWRKGASKEICKRIRNFYGSGAPSEEQDHEYDNATSTNLATLKKEAIKKKFGDFTYSTSRSYTYTHDGRFAGSRAAAAIDINRKIQEGAPHALPFLK